MQALGEETLTEILTWITVKEKVLWDLKQFHDL